MVADATTSAHAAAVRLLCLNLPPATPEHCRFEDAYALLSFLKTSYTDRPANASAVDWTVYEMKARGGGEILWKGEGLLVLQDCIALGLWEDAARSRKPSSLACAMLGSQPISRCPLAGLQWQGPAEDNPNYVRPFVDLEGLDDGSQQGPMGG